MVSAWETLPGETPIDDVSGLKIKGIRTRTELNKIEAENIRKAYVKYLAAKPTRRMARFDLAWVLQLHREMFEDVWMWAGTVRTTEKNLGVPSWRIQTDLQTLLDDLTCWDREEMDIDIMEQAVRLHHRAVYIHPFENGNGRWARLLSNIWLRLHDHPPLVWPEATIGTESLIRAEYLAAIRAADRSDYCQLMELHRRFTANEE